MIASKEAEQEFLKSMAADISQFLSIIVPSFHEGDSIQFALDALKKDLPEAEVWVIDAGCAQTKQQVVAFQKKWPSLYYIYNENDRGKGHAIREGIRRCSRPLIAQFDADLQFMSGDLRRLLELMLSKKVDLICGSRFLKDSHRESMSVPGARSLGNRAISWYSSLWTGRRYTDVLAGIKIWRREVTESFQMQSDDYCYEVELPIKASRKGFLVIEAPISTAARKHGKSSVNVLKTGVNLLKKIPRFQFQSLDLAS